MTALVFRRFVRHGARTLSGLFGILAIASGSAHAAAVVTTGGGSNQIVVYQTPNNGLPNPAATHVQGLPAGAKPEGVSCLGNTCLIGDSGNFRVLVVDLSTASVIDTITMPPTIPYSGAGTMAISPDGSVALALAPLGFTGQLIVIHAPFSSASSITTVPLTGVQLGGTQSIVFGAAGRAFLCTGSIAVLDPPYTAMELFLMASPGGCGQLAITPDGNTLLAPTGKQVNIFKAPFSAASTPEVLQVPQADMLAGPSVTTSTTTALVVDKDGKSIWSISAPFTATSPVERIPLPALLPALQQIAISPDDQLAIAAGGGGTNPRLLFLRPPFTAALATPFTVFVEGSGIGFGGATFNGPAGAPDTPTPPTCGPITASAAEAIFEPRQDPFAGAVPLVAAILPSSRSVRVGCPATAFVTIINAGGETAHSVGIAPTTNVPVDFAFRTTDAANVPNGALNAPVDIPPQAAQTYVISLTPRANIAPTDVVFSFPGADTALVTPLVGINTLLLSGSTTDVPDIVALTATPTNDGIVNLPAATNVNAFAVATVNVGIGGSITVSADTGGAQLPISIVVCQTDAGGACIQTAEANVTTFINSGATPTFAFFVAGGGVIPFDPAANRIFARFKDAGGFTRGSSSVAVRSTN